MDLVVQDVGGGDGDGVTEAEVGLSPLGLSRCGTGGGGEIASPGTKSTKITALAL